MSESVTSNDPPAKAASGTTAATSSRTRIAVGIGLTAATGTMTSIATQTGGTFWAAHAWVAWMLLGLLVAALVINELPRLLSANFWLTVLTGLGLALSLTLWISVRDGAPLPHDGSDPGSLTGTGQWPADSVDQADAPYLLDGREVGDVSVYVSQRYQVVWGVYMVEATADRPEIDVKLTAVRLSDGRVMPAGRYVVTPLVGRGEGSWTDTLAYDPAACYRVTAALTAAGHALAAPTTTWCGPQHR